MRGLVLSKIGDFSLYATSFPREDRAWEELKQRKVTHVVSFASAHDEQDVLVKHHIKTYNFPVPDFTAPSQSQLDEVSSLLSELLKDDKNVVACHCHAGLGRTGTFLSCFLVSASKLSAADAIKAIRTFRPGSVETQEQEKAVKEFEHRHKK
jgi:atypical dual specificity phosphatase